MIPEGPKPGDLDEHGVPFVEPEFDPFAHIDLTEVPEEAEEGEPDHMLLHELVNPSEWAECPTPEREWQLTNWIPARQMTYLTGAGSAGKSLFGQQLATCIGTGRQFLGIGTKRARALYLTCEDDYDELHRRQKSICEGLGMSLDSLDNNVWLLSLMGAIGNELATFTEAGQMKASQAFKVLQYTIKFRKIGFLVVDNVAHLFVGNENIRSQVAAFCGLLNKLASTTQTSILLIGHPNKAGEAYSGSTAWENQVRSRLFMEVPKDDEGNFIDTKARVLRREKSNYAENGEEINFRWHQMCFRTEADMPRDEFDRQVQDVKETADERAFITMLDERNQQGRHVFASKGQNYAPAIFAGLPKGRKIGKRRLEEAMERLYEKGFIGQIQVGKYNNRTPKMALGTTPEGAQWCTTRPRREGAQSDAQSVHNMHNVAHGEKLHNAARSPPLIP